MDLNTKIGRRITQRDIAMNKLMASISKIDFVYLGVRQYLEGPNVERYVTQTALKLIKQIGGFDPNLVRGIQDGTIRAKKAYIPIYDYSISYKFDGYQQYDTYYESTFGRTKFKTGTSVREVVKDTTKGNFFIPNNFGGLIRESVLRHHTIGLPTYTYSHVNSFEKETYYFYNHPMVLKTKTGLEEAAVAFGKNEMKHGVYSDRSHKPRDLKVNHYKAYLFEVMVFEYSANGASPAFIALTVFKPDEMFAYQQQQGARNEDYTGKGTSQATSSRSPSYSNAPSQTRAPSQPAPQPRVSATSLVTPTNSRPQPVKQVDASPDSSYRAGARRAQEREREAYMDLIWKKRNSYNTIAYVFLVLSALVGLIVNSSRFYLLVPYIGLVIGLRILFIKKFTFERRQDLTSFINENLDNMKQVLKTYRLLMIFGVLAAILFVVLMAII